MSDEYDGGQHLDAAEDPNTPAPDTTGAEPVTRPVRRPRPAPGMGYGPGRRSRVERSSTMSILVVPIFAVVALLALVAAITFDHFHGTGTASPTAVPTSPPVPTPVPTATLVVLPTLVTSKPGLAAEVNGEPVPLKVFNQESAAAAMGMQQQGTSLTAAAGLKSYRQQQQQILKNLIDSAYAVSFAKAHNLVATKDQIAALLTQYQTSVGGAAAFDQQNQAAGYTSDVVNQIVANNATVSNVLDYVTKDLPCPCDLHLRVILLKSTQKTLAATLAKQLQADHGANFAALAKKNSTEPTSAAKGGDMGYYSKGGLGDAAFDKAVFALKKGQVSAPLSTSQGIFIVQVIGQRPTSTVAQPYYTKWLAKQEAKVGVHTYVTIPKS